MMKFYGKFVSASIMAGGSHMQSGFNSIKLENPGYYCNSYTPPGAPDHHAMISASGYRKYIHSSGRFLILATLPKFLYFMF